MPEGEGDAATLAVWRSPVTPHHLRIGGDLIVQHEPVQVEIEWELEPDQAGALHVLPILFAHAAGVFACDAVAFEEAWRVGLNSMCHATSRRGTPALHASRCLFFLGLRILKRLHGCLRRRAIINVI